MGEWVLAVRAESQLYRDAMGSWSDLLRAEYRQGKWWGPGGAQASLSPALGGASVSQWSQRW